MILNNNSSNNKILLTSDLHFHDYSQRNPVPLQRLHQTRIVGNNIIKVARERNIPYIAFAGDTLEKSIVRPYVLAEVKNFLDNVMSNFQHGFIIWGNHDLDNKGSDQEFIDSSLSVMLPSNLEYADKKQFKIGNSIIGFSNWRPDEIDLSWVNGKLDYLVTHATIAYSISDQYASEKLDESKFDLAFCGDIHKPAEKGKYISIGIPQRCKMSDSEEQTGIILDLDNKTWERVNLNPDDNLMKFKYTEVQSKEGWDDSTKTWNVFKPAKFTITGDKKEDNPVAAWAVIDDLINNTIKENNLQKIHGEVIKNLNSVDSKEVDFNFTLTKISIKNWRSIEEADLYFNDGDRVLITGQNGSGKSSFLSALKYAFLENRYIKEFIQFGTKNCSVEVEFLYQGNEHKILRASNSYGYWLNGVAGKYNNKKEFENDMHIRFPFIDYMDIFFFDSDHHKLIGQLDPERKSEIISKFFKMDKIDQYCEVASKLLKAAGDDVTNWQNQIDQQQKIYEYIEKKIQNLSIPTVSEEELLKKRLEYKTLQEKYELYNKFITNTANIKGKISSTETLIEKYTETAANLRDLTTLRQLYIQLTTKKDLVEKKLKELELLKLDEKRLVEERQAILKDPNPVCKMCGQSLNKGELLMKHKQELDIKIQELLNKQNIIYTEFEKDGYSRDVVDSKSFDFIKTISDVTTEGIKRKELEDTIVNLKKELQNYKQELSNLGTCPPEVNLPDDFFQKTVELNTQISIWKEYKSSMSDKQNISEKIGYLNINLENSKLKESKYKEYVELTGPTGKIYKEIMDKLAKQFTDNQVKYEVYSYTLRGKKHLDLRSIYLNCGNEVSYQGCSSGQQTVLDINFLSKIITNKLGLLVMDEFLKHLDPKNHDICIEMISGMNIGTTFLSSHMESIAAFNNKSLMLELNSSGLTKIDYK